jgi:hypothetical protein
MSYAGDGKLLGDWKDISPAGLGSVESAHEASTMIAKENKISSK